MAALEVTICSGLPTQLVIIAILGGFGMRPILPGGAWSPPFVFALTLLDTVLLLGLILFFIHSHGESARTMLFGTRPLRQEMVIGLLIIPISLALALFVLSIVQILAPTLRNVPRNPLEDLLQSRLDTFIFGCVVTLAGGVREEVQRAFVLRRFEQYLGGGAVGLAIYSVVFGLGHVEQGYDIVMTTATLGLYWGAVYLKRRSILGPMIGHAGFDLVQVIKYFVLRG